MYKLTTSVVVLSVLAGCSSPSALQDLHRAQETQTQILEQQAMRLEMQEEYMAQLAESQLALVASLNRVSRQLGQLREPPAPAEKVENETAKGAAKTETQELTETLDVAAVEKKQIVGRNEWVWLELFNRNLKARIDTGASSSSLSAVDLQPFERDGREWIRFRVPDEEHPDGGDVYETPLIKHVRIRQASAEELDRRPVVRLKVRLGELVDQVEFNLTNREDMLYPVLLGRNFLRDVALVDVAQKFVQPKYIPDTSSLTIQ
jgi:hypothetical protein